jgi:[FeFe] hydrogenase H-cluster maturation GTPase HydF
MDKGCIAICCTTEDIDRTLAALKEPPHLIITDSQVFDIVEQKKPAESLLTSFSVLMAAHKGDIRFFVRSAMAIDRLTEQSRVLIAEACTHVPDTEDIGRVKIPALLRKRTGELDVDIAAGNNFPEDLSPYSLIIHCGACVANARLVRSRIRKAAAAGVPITNYGLAIAYLQGILPRISLP